MEIDDELVAVAMWSSIYIISDDSEDERYEFKSFLKGRNKQWVLVFDHINAIFAREKDSR